MDRVDFDLTEGPSPLGNRVRPNARSTAPTPLRDIPQPTRPMRADLGLTTYLLTLLTVVAGVGGIAFWLVGNVTGLVGISTMGVLLLLGCVVLAVLAWLSAGAGE